MELTEASIEQMNEMIGTFMGYKMYDKRYPRNHGIGAPEMEPEKCMIIQKAKYHYSWDVLMPVVEKISSLDNEKYCFHISSTGQWACYINRDDVFDNEICSYGGFEPMILNVHKAVYKFIQWYNQQINKP